MDEVTTCILYLGDSDPIANLPPPVETIGRLAKVVAHRQPGLSCADDQNIKWLCIQAHISPWLLAQDRYPASKLLRITF
jgi:hypothetical protein